MCNDDDDKEAYSTPAMNVSPAPMVLNIDRGAQQKAPQLLAKRTTTFFFVIVLCCVDPISGPN